MTVDAFISEIGSRVAGEVQNSPTAFLEGLKANYLLMGDPTGYYFATRHLTRGWAEWLEYLADPETGPMIGQWQNELIAKLSADSLARIIDAAKSEGKDSLGANKYLYDTFTTKEDKKNNVGRPTRERIQREAKALVEDEKIKEEAYYRIFKDAKEEV